MMGSSDDEHRGGLADAAGRAAFFPARAAARAWRGPLEEVVDEVLYDKLKSLANLCGPPKARRRAGDLVEELL
jgi:hypothetical protein